MSKACFTHKVTVDDVGFNTFGMEPSVASPTSNILQVRVGGLLAIAVTAPI